MVTRHISDYVYLKDGELTKLEDHGRILWEKKAEGNAIDIAKNRIYVAGSTTRDTSTSHRVNCFRMGGNQRWDASRTSAKGEGPINVCKGTEGVYIVDTGTMIEYCEIHYEARL